ncbi:conserved hypothetical protein [Pediculus humanus corporis]|uniref:Uncharacterized protein n=1 Tax=Pediculus humanus subsp. corporis TaxID=121224 RepID=E0VMG8_PEDHC|nr:uncharacterized protein Phum_PHUM308930 [Pediculus humanus corporis]EEB14574.1 conserved hypothetical protein [Pediculus humanus corporis]
MENSVNILKSKKKKKKMAEVLKNSRNIKNTNSRGKSQYISKVKCSTLQTPSNYPGSENKIMLGLKDLNDEDSFCEYEKKSSNRMFLGESVTLHKKNESTKGTDLGSCLSQCEQENSKAFIGSLGSWINDFFNVQNKRPNTEPKIKTKTFLEETLCDEDTEYFKSINILKEQFRKKLKSKTSIQILNGDKLLHFSFNEKTPKKKSNSMFFTKLLVQKGSIDKTNGGSTQEEVEEEEEEVPDFLNAPPPAAAPTTTVTTTSTTLEPAGKPNDEISMQLYRSKNSLDLSQSVIIRKKSNKKKRSNTEILDEFGFHSSKELPKKLLLNVRDQDKRTSQLYKAMQVGVQEAQRKSKSYQNSTRCYTTNATMADSIENFNAPKEKKENVLSLSTGRRKVLAGFTRDNSTYVKVRPQKSVNVPFETSKTDFKLSSDDLVKYLMKKVKANHKPVKIKKKAINVGSVTPTAMTSAHATISTSFVPATAQNKSKFMQSATSSLVTNVLSKKENDLLLTIKNNARHLADKNESSSKPWVVKRENGRLETKRTSAQNKFDKSSYLSDDINEMKDNLLLDKTTKNSKKLLIKQDASDKFIKREEVKSMLSKIDFKSETYKLNKHKQKEMKKKSFPANVGGDLTDILHIDNPNARFQLQHELFKNSPRNFEQSPNSNEVEETYVDNDESKLNSEVGSSGGGVGSPSKELAVISNNYELIPQPNDNDPKELSEISINNKEIFNLKNSDCFNIDDETTTTIGKNSIPDIDINDNTNNHLLQNDNSKDLLDLSPCSQPLNDISKSKDNFDSFKAAFDDNNIVTVKTEEFPKFKRRFSENLANEVAKRKWPITQNKSHNSNVVHNVKAKDSNREKKINKRRDKGKKHELIVDELTDICGYDKTKKIISNCDEET